MSRVSLDVYEIIARTITWKTLNRNFARAGALSKSELLSTPPSPWFNLQTEMYAQNILWGKSSGAWTSSAPKCLGAKTTLHQNVSALRRRRKNVIKMCFSYQNPSSPPWRIARNVKLRESDSSVNLDMKIYMEFDRIFSLNVEQTWGIFLRKQPRVILDW